MARLRVLFCFLLTMVLSIILFSSAVFATYYRVIDAESASINSSSLSLTDNGKTYVHIKKGEFVTPWISPSQHYRGAHAIGFQMNPTSGTAPDGQNMDKSNFRLIAGNETNALGFMETKYTGYALKLEAAHENPEQPVQLFQWWQGSPFSPPLEMRIKAGSTDYEFVYRNDSTGRGPSAAQVLYTGSMTKDVWYRFVVYTKMSHTNDGQTGQIKIWVNGNLVKDWNGDVGYEPDMDYYYAGSYYQANPKFDIFFGLYRNRQMKTAKVMFDQVKFTSTYNEANPDN